MKIYTKTYIAVALFCAMGVTANATLYRSITGSGATIDATGNLTQGGVTYPVIYKPSSTTAWVKHPWMSPSQLYAGTKSIGFEIDPVSSYASGDTDKVQHRLSSGNDSFALTFGNKRYTGFAVKLASDFNVAAGRKCMIAQWWQGSPYGPPVRLDVSGTGTFQFLVLNNDTLGNPSAIPINIGGGTIARNSWNTFVVMIIPNFTGGGQVKVWQNGTQIIAWTGKVGYDPSTDPYAGGSGYNPNPKFDVFYGPYRETQNAKQQMFFNNIKFADTYSEATP